MVRSTAVRDVVVIGAGQAGLAIGRLLANAGVDFVLLDAHDRIGDNWRNRYLGLTLFTPRRYSALAGMAMEGDPDGYPDKDEFGDYLEAFARRHGMPVIGGATVTSVVRKPDGGFAVSGDGFETIHAATIVVACGAFKDPVVPRWANGLEIPHIAAEAFGNGTATPNDPLLIVGDGASGRDIAAIAVGRRKVVLATGRPRRLLPERIFGRSLWWWLDVTGLVRASGASVFGRFMRKTDPFPDRNRSLRALDAMGVEIKGRAVGAEENMVFFDDGTFVRPGGIVWALGYKPDWSFLSIWEAFDPPGKLLHDQGVSPVPGLFFLGLPWQSNRASGLVMGVSDDAAHLMRTLGSYLETKNRRPSTT